METPAPTSGSEVYDSGWLEWLMGGGASTESPSPTDPLPDLPTASEWEPANVDVPWYDPGPSSYEPGVDVLSEFAAGMTVPLALAGVALLLLARSRS